ncbi:unnamed protein product [Paramecium sonneborni]|uniref:Uncharacterized protein n=1 Tax=Paramecium sonneborni TaxID=65129 RepID=A0A8S1RQ77_9CILI|nr:unnamed protein product [Paramecium sonneborni]
MSVKVGRWDIMYSHLNKKEYKQIGGGSYNQEGNQKKIGKWIELDEGFYYNYYNQITYNGEYNMNGKKVGKWDILYIMYDRWGIGQYKQMQILNKLKGRKQIQIQCWWIL